MVPCEIDQQRHSGNKQPGNEWKCAGATLAQTSDVQAILMKLAAAGSLLSAAEYIDIHSAEPTEQEMSDKKLFKLCCMKLTSLMKLEKMKEKKRKNWTLHHHHHFVVHSKQWQYFSSNLSVIRTQHWMRWTKSWAYRNFWEKGPWETCVRAITGYFNTQ